MTLIRVNPNNLYSLEEIKRLLQENGFIEDIDGGYWHNGVCKFMNWFSAWEHYQTMKDLELQHSELESIYALAREYAHDGDLQNRTDLADGLEKIAARLGKLLGK